jgi:UDP-2,3-diacylglucosamine pyrophosphatase LpxH
MARTKRIFISDVHLNSSDRYNAENKLARARFNPKKHQKRLINFLNKTVLEKQKEIKDFVLVGDIFDDWVAPPDEAPPTFKEIFESNTEIMIVFRKIAKTGVNFYYLPGNHDYSVKKTLIQSEIPSVIMQQAYDDPGLKLHAEHGNKHVLFNKSIRDIANGRPIGYYITRLTEHLGGYVTRFHDLISYSDNLIELAAGKNKFFSELIKALAERARVKEIVMNARGRKIKINEIRKAYAALDKRYNLFEAVMKMTKEGELENIADHLSKKKKYKVVIFGHTHKAKIDKDSFLVDDRIYANTGCWCQKKAHCVIVDAPANKKTSVKLCRVGDTGSAVKVEEEKI